MQQNGVVSGSNFEQKTGCKPYPINPKNPNAYATSSCIAKCTNSKWTISYNSDKKFGIF